LFGRFTKSGALLENRMNFPSGENTPPSEDPFAETVAVLNDCEINSMDCPQVISAQQIVKTARNTCFFIVALSSFYQRQFESGKNTQGEQPGHGSKPHCEA